MAITLTKSYQLLAETKLGSWGYGTLYLREYGKYDSQSIADNTTTYTLKLAIYCDGDYCNSGNCYAYISGTCIQNNTNLTFPTNGELTLGTKKSTVTHNDDGTRGVEEGGSFSCYAGTDGSVNAYFELPTIPRYATSNQSLKSKTETTITMNWSSDNTVDYIWYSTDNGSTWTGVDVTDGTSGTYTISGLTANTTYKVKTRVRRKDSQLTTDSSALSVKTYALPTQSLSSKTETTATIKWSVDSTADMIYYSTDNGSTWSSGTSVSGTSGSYTISGLSAYTTYKVKTRVRRKSTQTLSNTSTLSVTTYPYPYCTSTPNFTIGSALTLTFYNPLGRSITITGIGADSSTIFTGSTTGTSLTGFNDSGSVTKQYASIPSAKSSTYQVQVTYNGVTKTRNNGNTYSIKGTEKPTFTNFTYNDGNTVTTTLTGNNQILVKSLSDINVIVTTANKAVGKNSAIIKKYRVKVGNQTTEMAYSSSSTVSAVVFNATTGTIQVTAIDSRGLETTVTKNATLKNWNKQIYSTVKVDRQNGVGTTGLLNLKVNFWKGNFGAVDNQITKFSYRYKKTTDSSYSSYINITDRMDVNEDDEYYINLNDAFLPTTDEGTTATEFEVGCEYNIQFACVDKTQTIVYSNVLILNSGIPCTAKQKNSDGTYSIGVNKLPNINSGGGLDIKGRMYVSDIILSKNKHIMSYRNIVSENYTFNEAITPGVYSVQSETGISDGPYTVLGPTYGLLVVYTNTMTDWNKSNNWIFQVFINTGGTVYTRYAINSNSFTDWGNGFLFNGATQKIVNTLTNPTDDTWYTIPFISGTATGRYGIMSNNGLRFITGEGTTSKTGLGALVLGNGTAGGTVGNKSAILRLYSTGAGYIDIRPNYTASTNYVVYVPAENGTIQLKPTQLYNNTTGTNGTVTLSQSAANFTYLEIFFRRTSWNYCGSAKVYSPDGKIATLSIIARSPSATNYFNMTSKSVTISGTSITVTDESATNVVNSGNTTVSDGTALYITQVIGYK